MVDLVRLMNELMPEFPRVEFSLSDEQDGVRVLDIGMDLGGKDEYRQISVYAIRNPKAYRRGDGGIDFQEQLYTAEDRQLARRVLDLVDAQIQAQP